MPLTHRVLIAALAIATASPAIPVLAQSGAAQCAPDNAGLTLPAGFCAQIVADSVGNPRHVVVAPNGDVYVALRRAAAGSGVMALRDTNGDGVADERHTFGVGAGSGIALANGVLYFATDTSVVRWRLAPGALVPTGEPEVVVSGLARGRAHSAKTIAIANDGALFVNIGAPSNSCQSRDRQSKVPGMDPCTLLDTAGGIWRFSTGRTGQRQSDGERWATGLRNVVAITLGPDGATPWGAQHGRDMLSANWGFDEAYNAENPGEELFRITQGSDFGWPTCYWSTALKKKVLAPEYGGDGTEVGRCADVGQPLVTFPGHWAPNAMLFYGGAQFPERYRGGIFVAFHGSWNRAPLPQAGFNVVFVPMANGAPSGPYEVFADGFRDDERRPHRPSGLAVAPDGSLVVTDDTRGRVYRISYTGGR
ncbi:MAG TPA: PQQ-dependent sugar dehydrogenase [Gemmatimonadaceae bacterium]|nr:PQQ-dependent sugar dehydrogenase [Gemmatimonadaceae bacterium]